MASEVISMIRKQVKPALVILLLLTLVTGIIYPLLVTGLSQLVFPYQANGNLIEHDGKVVGSELIGQPFTSPGYFWGRPSATSPEPYNAMSSSGSNLGPSNPVLIDAVKARVDALHAADPTNTLPIPVDLVTASGSGLDPDISVAAAYYQVPRVARARNLSEQDLNALVARHIEGRQFGIFGEPRVNVLSLNLALDDLVAHRISLPGAVVPDSPGRILRRDHLWHERGRLDPAHPLLCRGSGAYRPSWGIHGRDVYRETDVHLTCHRIPSRDGFSPPRG